MNGGFIIIPILTIFTLLTFVSYATEAPAKERMPIWDRIALSDVKLYTSEGLDEPTKPAVIKKGTWAKLLKHSDNFSSDYVELEAGGKYWIQGHAMFPLYYVVGRDDLVVQMPGSSATPKTEVLAHPGDMVAVDHTSPAPKDRVLVWNLDGSKSGLASIYQMEPVGDPGTESD